MSGSFKLAKLKAAMSGWMGSFELIFSLYMYAFQSFTLCSDGVGLAV